MDRMVAISVTAVVIAIIAAVIDVRERRIPNKLTYSAFILGILLQAVLEGWKGVLSGMLGAVVFGGLFLLFYIVHGMGAGDVKLAAPLGCLAGIPASLNLMAATAAAGGILAVIYMVRAHRVAQTLRNTLSILVFHKNFGFQAHPTVNLENAEALRMPYGLAFAAGTVFWSMSTLWWR
jgi:prepilin peptidase CpaA